MTTGEGKGGRGREREGERKRETDIIMLWHITCGGERKMHAIWRSIYVYIATVYPIHVHSVHYYTGECEREKKGTVTAKYSSLSQPQQGSGGVSHQWCFLWEMLNFMLQFWQKLPSNHTGSFEIWSRIRNISCFVAIGAEKMLTLCLLAIPGWAPALMRASQRPVLPAM